MTVLWDNDGVLVDTERLFFRSTSEVLAQVGVSFTKKDFIEISLRQGQSAFSLAEEKGLTAAQIEDLREKRNQLYSKYLRMTPCVIDGVEDVLKELYGRVSMAVVTSSRRDHFDIIHAHSGLLQYFDFFLTLEDYPRSKPAPDPYLTALKRHQIRPEDCVVVEDSERGLASALAAGLRCLVIPNEMASGSAYRGALKILDRISDVPAEVMRLNCKLA